MSRKSRPLFGLQARSIAKLPHLDVYDENANYSLAKVKFFMPDGLWTWYASAFDGTELFFGLVEGRALEYGYFSLSELEKVRGPYGLRIERDRYFLPILLDDLFEKLSRQHGWSNREINPKTDESSRLSCFSSLE
jgi:hypothetical protein